MDKEEQEIHDLIIKYYDVWEYIDTLDWLGDPEAPKDIKTMKNLEGQRKEVLRQIIKKCKELEE